MKLLWVKADFLHPTDRGGQIRTLEILKRLHARHKVHYIGLNHGNAEGVARSNEYCSHVYPIEHRVPEKNTLAFAGQLLAGLVSPLPVVVARYRSEAMKREIEKLSRSENFDAVVCDFLFPAANLPDPSACVLFQHNVEATIWKRHATNGRTPLHRAYFHTQARRMEAFEAATCRAVKSIVAVSEIDADRMRRDYRAERVSAVSTGVDLDYFARPAASPRVADLVFVGSMDWMPNIDGAQWFAREVLPLIRKRRPECTVVFAGRKPSRAVQELAAADSRLRVTGTVPDIRPYVWGAGVSIVPLRIGGGTRLKIFESMAAEIPVVSTTIGAEGLPVEAGREIHLADSPEDFAARCLDLLDDSAQAKSMSEAARTLVESRFSWDAVAREFEQLLQS